MASTSERRLHSPDVVQSIPLKYRAKEVAGLDLNHDAMISCRQIRRLFFLVEYKGEKRKKKSKNEKTFMIFFRKKYKSWQSL